MPGIAVVDSDTMLLELLRDVFLWQGWDLVPVTDERTCGRLLHAPPDLIILDPWLGSPDRGWPILRFLHGQPTLRRVPFIVWTAGAARLGEEAAWLEEHGIPLLDKPFELDELVKVIEAALSGTRDD